MSPYAWAYREELEGVTERYLAVSEDNTRLKTERVAAQLADSEMRATLQSKVVPARYCSPRHRVPFHSSDEGSKRVR